jgi:hydrogenase-4 membrane subunit HyfE
MFDFTLHAGTRCYFIFHKHVFVVFLFYCFQHKRIKKNKKKLREKIQNFIFFLLITFQILHVFLSDISIHCALIEYAYI